LKKVLTTIAAGLHQSLIEYSGPSFERFSKLHDYKLVVQDKIVDSSNPPAWSKLAHILDLMDEYQEILWIDSDALIIKNDVDIKSIIHEKSDLAWTYHSYDNQTHPNSGVMFIKVNNKTRKLFSDALMQKDLVTHPWWDQGALMRVLGIESSVWPVNAWRSTKKNILQEQKLPLEWNSIRFDAVKNPRIRHFAGEPFQIKKFLMAEYAHPTSNSPEVLQHLIDSFSAIEETKNRNRLLEVENETLRLDLKLIHSSRIWKFMRRWTILKTKVSKYGINET
jgi:hypothetical protein